MGAVCRFFIACGVREPGEEEYAHIQSADYGEGGDQRQGL
ncbi:hypothetical protein ELI_1473 [Eubacterium callanderi]|uniref:Uncharacterized protein n=1 Tax=Eubacterium callanderi TaxID=53442 RepID=E3GLE5_9FIRM|nr:hypothetical protein ELI_1473 [Eubacterium callanderi]